MWLGFSWPKSTCIFQIKWLWDKVLISRELMYCTPIMRYMHHMECKGIPHDHVLYLLAICMRFAFWPCCMIFENLRKLQFKIFRGKKWLKPWHKNKTKWWYAVWGHTPFIRSLGAPHASVGLMWHCWSQSLRSMAPRIKQLFGVSLNIILSLWYERTTFQYQYEGTSTLILHLWLNFLTKRLIFLIQIWYLVTKYSSKFEFTT